MRSGRPSPQEAAAAAQKAYNDAVRKSEEVAKPKQYVNPGAPPPPPPPIAAIKAIAPILEKIPTRNIYGGLSVIGNKEIDEIIKHLDYLYGLPKGHSHENKIKELELKYRDLATKNPEVVARASEWLEKPRTIAQLPKEEIEKKMSEIEGGLNYYGDKISKPAQEKDKKIYQQRYDDYAKEYEELDAAKKKFNPENQMQANSIKEQENPFVNILKGVEHARPAQLPPWMLPHHGMQAMIPQHQVNEQQSPLNAYVQNILGQQMQPARYSPRATGSAWEKILSHFDPDLLQEMPF